MPRTRPPLLHHTVHRSHAHAPWVVLVHGAGVTAAIWANQLEAYRDEFNLLVPDLRGHGASPGLGGDPGRESYTLEGVSQDVLDVMDHHGIEAAHFVAISMGCLITRTIADMAPERVRSMVLGGAIGRLSLTARILIALAHALKHVVPHLWLYRFYAWVLLPRRSHLESRRIVVRDARRLVRAEFLRWLTITHELPRLLRNLEDRDPGVPALYVMGDEDHMFLAGVRAVAARHRSAQLHVLDRCGHVCTVQRPDAFNRLSLEFLRRT